MAEQLPLFAQAPNAAPDQAQRDRVTGDLDTTLFVEAGAGSGKTTALVQRVLNLVLTGVPITSIAAITFTEKAAAELRVKIRDELTRRATVALAQPHHSSLIATALADLDTAPIGTLHAFARRLLNEFPVEAALPPRFEVLDEVQSATAFHERFTDFLEALLDDTASVRLVELCQYDRFGVERGVRRMAEDFQANWDLVDERVSAAMPPPADVARHQRTLAATCGIVAAHRPPEGDKAEPLRAEFADHAAAFAGTLPFGEFLRRVLAVTDVTYLRRGNTNAWKKVHGGVDMLATFKDDVAAAVQAATTAIVDCNDERRLTLGALLREFTLGSVQARCEDGLLEFHDLLVLSRRMVREHEGVRTLLHQRYIHLLLDEFQDTDPIQLELAVRITAEPAGQPADWRQVQPLPGRLMVVGDPKQSIYRFRRADIGQFLRAREQIGASAATLSANFRSAEPVIRWVNTTMSTLIQAQEGVQPAYEPLVAARAGEHRHGTVTVLGAEPHDDLGRAGAELLREREAADVAAVVVTALTRRWSVHDAEAPDGLRPCNPGDIAILLPSRLSLPALQAALAAAGVPYRAENSSLVYGAPEVRALMLALRAADDPTDELAIAAALRTPLFGCSDRDLYDWKVQHGQHWSWRHLPDELADHPVAIGLRCLAEVETRIRYSTPSQLLTWLVQDRCVMELALAQRDSRDAWRRVRFVIDQARAWSEAGGHGVRRYLLWTRLQGDEGRFVAETVLPETDHDVVRIMTVHAAKGLEFPITVVSGLTTRGGSQPGRRVVWTHDGWTLSSPDDPVYQQFAPVDEAMGDAERRRLLYVACTRAMDHLVVSLHRPPRDNGSAAFSLALAAAEAEHHLFQPAAANLAPAAVEPRELPWADEAEWSHAWHTALSAADQPAALSATTLARRLHDPAAAGDPGAAKDPVDLDLPPWQRGRYGTAVGRAVHAVLQFADLTDGHDIPALAAAQAASEGVFGHERLIERLAQSALQAPVVADGVRGQHWRELFVAASVGDAVIEGYIDLLVRHPQHGLLVVDYKTDQVASGPDRDARLRRYGVQLAAYGVALSALLDEPVRGGVLVMCRPGGPAEQVDIPDWDSLQQGLRAQLAQDG